MITTNRLKTKISTPSDQDHVDSILTLAGVVAPRCTLYYGSLDNPDKYKDVSILHVTAEVLTHTEASRPTEIAT